MGNLTTEGFCKTDTEGTIWLQGIFLSVLSKQVELIQLEKWVEFLTSGVRELIQSIPCIELTLIFLRDYY